MADYIFDIILILVSGSACLYCWLLSRRLKALHDLKQGLGASIVNLSNAISKTSIAAQEAKLSAADSVEQLQSLLKEVEASIPKVDMMLENLERNAQRTQQETSDMKKDLILTVRPLLDEAHDKANTLSLILTEVDRYSSRQFGRNIDDQSPSARKAAS